MSVLVALECRDLSDSSDIRNDLDRVRSWADAKIAAGQEPPWAWFQYMKLRETLDAILAGIDHVTTENLPQSAERSGAPRLRVVVDDSLDDAPLRLAGSKLQLPT